MSFPMNPPIIDNAHLGTNAVQTDNITNAHVDKNKLKVGAGEFDQTYTAAATRTVTMHDYSFFPLMSSNCITFSDMTVNNSLQSSASYIGRFAFSSYPASTRYNHWWRYMTSSDEPFLQFLIEAGADFPTGLWSADDPPNHLWGLDEMPAEPEAAPVYSKDMTTGLLLPADDVFIFKYDLEHFKAMREKAKTDRKTLFDILKNDYEIDKATLKALKKGDKIKSKNIGEI